MYKAIIAALALSAPALAIKKPAHGAAALRVRGGTFGFDAHQTGEQCGIEEPEKEVVKTIKSAVTYPLKVLGIRGGALLDVSARETAEACEIEDPEPLVVRTIKAAFDYTAERVLESGVVPDEKLSGASTSCGMACSVEVSVMVLPLPGGPQRISGL